MQATTRKSRLGPSITNPDENPTLRRGDHLRAGRPGAPHDGIYLGNGHVIHLTGIPGGGKADTRVRIDTLADFAAGRPATIRPYAGNHDPYAIIARAMSRLGDGGYNLIFNNCQHFARLRNRRSHQRAGQFGSRDHRHSRPPVVAASVGINVVGSAGFVVGLSGVIARPTEEYGPGGEAVRGQNAAVELNRHSRPASRSASNQLDYSFQRPARSRNSTDAPGART